MNEKKVSRFCSGSIFHDVFENYVRYQSCSMEYVCSC
jgi:hypothetical protein